MMLFTIQFMKWLKMKLVTVKDSKDYFKDYSNRGNLEIRGVNAPLFII